MNKEMRGARSFLPDVKKPANKPCSLKRHFTGCLRQVVGYAEKLANNDAERFIWTTERGFLKHAVHRNSQRRYSLRQVRYSLQTAEQLGLLTPALKVRKGVTRIGFVVAAHDDIAVCMKSRCILNTRSRESSRARGKKRSVELKGAAFSDRPSSCKNNRSSSETELNASLCAIPSASRTISHCLCAGGQDCLCPDSETLPRPALTETPGEHWLEASCEIAAPEPSQPVSPVQDNPVKNNPVLENSPKSNSEKPKTTPSDLFTSTPDSDSDKNSWSEKAHIAIGLLETMLTGSDRDIELLSDGEFNTSYLSTYAHSAELIDCCKEAIRVLAHRPFQGRRSLADLMGKAMELLRSDHELNAPRGWLPIIQKLRASPDADRLTSISSTLYEALEEAANKIPDEKNPENIFDTWYSGIGAIDAQAAEELESDPTIREIFVCVAKRHFVLPRCYMAGTWFMDEVEQEFKVRGIPFPPAARQIQEKLEPYRNLSSDPQRTKQLRKEWEQIKPS